MQSIRAKIQDANSELFNHLHQINAQKLGQLIGPQIISEDTFETLQSKWTPVTAEHLPLWFSHLHVSGGFEDRDITQ